MRIGVVGAGVSGLSSAIRLADAGYDVTVLSRDLAERTTSHVAAAFWFPYRVEGSERATRWALETYRTFEALAEEPRTGVRRATVEHRYLSVMARPDWSVGVRAFRQMPETELGTGYRSGFSYESYVIETPLYMPYLRSRADAARCDFAEEHIGSLQSVADRFDAIVNCSGVWARHLVADDRVFPIRGQVVRVRKPEGCTSSVLDSEGAAYIVPRTDDCILGGTADVGEWDMTPSAEAAAGILDRCGQLDRKLKGAHVIESLVGLRPGRDEVRVEREVIDGKRVIHNYGHGGAGFTLSWGCASEVLKLLD